MWFFVSERVLLVVMASATTTNDDDCGGGGGDGGGNNSDDGGGHGHIRTYITFIIMYACIRACKPICRMLWTRTKVYSAIITVIIITMIL